VLLLLPRGLRAPPRYQDPLLWQPGPIPISPARVRRVEHLVCPGDTLQGLALRYGVTASQSPLHQRLHLPEEVPQHPRPDRAAGAVQRGRRQGGRGEEGGEGAATEGQPEREKGRLHRSSSHAERRAEVSASDFMNKLDTRIRVSKRAAVKKIREGESAGAEKEAEPSRGGYQSPSLSRSHEGSPQTQQRSLLGPVPLTVTTRTSTLRDHEDEIFKL
ncbi:unnamed protein product, partial [Staurois parvus]